MDGRDPGIPRKIPIIQRENIGQAVNQHGGHEPGIMHLRARYRVAYNQPTPFHMHGFVVWQEPERGFDDLGALVSFGG